MFDDARLHLFDTPRLVLFYAAAVQVPFLASTSWETRDAINSIRVRAWKWGCEKL